MNRELILVQNNQVNLPAEQGVQDKNSRARAATVLNNMAYYGYTLNKDAFQQLMNLSDQAIVDFWSNFEPVLSEVTGANRRMDDFVVYKNFPVEVLAMDEAEYWLNQICMYIGVPNEYFTEEEKERPRMVDLTTLRVLYPASEDACQKFYDSMVALPVRWNTMQLESMQFLVQDLNIKKLDVSDFGFKENAIVLIKSALASEQAASIEYSIKDATDVLRLAAAMSDSDVSLRNKVRFRKFKRSERKMMLAQLELSKNLEQDVAGRQEVWKRLLSNLHPGDYKFKNVQQVFDSLYKGTLKTFNSHVELGIKDRNQQVMDLLKSRPGEFARRLHKLYELFGNEAIQAFREVASTLETMQLLKLSGYVSTINDRKTLVYAPRGKWSSLQVGENTKTPFSEEDKLELMSVLNQELKARMNQRLPEGVNLDSRLQTVKLQTNDQKLASYGRGTTFDIPENMKFLRTASYWKHKTGYNCWFDNGWNLFDQDWKNVANVCWNSERFENAAIFSGDPTNSKDMEGRACQMIDLYLDDLEAKGVRYAVWNILAYSRIVFDDADEVLATLQWGENPETGNLYEPARAQMVFPLTGQNLTKYIAYVDVVERKLVYMDANLPGHVCSADSNGPILEKHMPAYVEYLKSLPTVADLFGHADAGELPVLYSDEEVELKEQKAYVFKPVNTENSFEALQVTDYMV